MTGKIVSTPKPPGTVLVHTLGGAKPVSGAVEIPTGLRLSDSTAPYVGRGKKCSGDEDTCNGYRAKGTEYCAGHLRSLGLL